MAFNKTKRVDESKGSDNSSGILSWVCFLTQLLISFVAAIELWTKSAVSIVVSKNFLRFSLYVSKISKFYWATNLFATFNWYLFESTSDISLKTLANCLLTSSLERCPKLYPRTSFIWSAVWFLAPKYNIPKAVEILNGEKN
jgi:hypothetical protein